MAWFKRRPVLLAIVTLAGLAAILIPYRSTSSDVALAGDVLPPRPAPAFRLTDQFGHTVTLRQFRGRPVLVTFLQAACTGLCPLTTETIRRTLAELGPDGRRLVILAISSDPEGDTPAAVRSFSLRHGMLHRWYYLTGSRQRLTGVWRSYYIFVAPPDSPPRLKAAHTSAIYLLDAQGRERVLMVGDPATSSLARDIRILSGLSPAGALDAAVPAPQVGHPAPDFTLRSLTGRAVHLDTLRHATLLNFWATWCTPCRRELPMLDSWYRRQRGAVLVLGVDQQEPRGTVASYLREVGATYPVVLDGDGSVSDRYDVVGLPTSLLVNRHGVVAAVHQGAIDAAFLAKLHSLLSG